MRFLWMTCFLLASLYFVNAETETEEKKSDVTKLDVVDLSEAESDAEVKDSEVQRKRDSGYSYNRPDRLTLTTRARFQLGQSAYKGRIVNKHPGQINRPVSKYGPPTHQNSPLTKLSPHGQQHRDKLHHQGHFNQQQSNNFAGRPAGPLFQQEVPSPIRHNDFTEPNPIASQNNEPFGFNTANYLPPRNQKLPGYTAPQSFATGFRPQTSQANVQANLQTQNIVQSQEQPISDAALFLSENAHAIQQLYGSPATEQEFAPHNDQFAGNNNNQVQQSQLQNFESGTLSPFPGALPSYASGTLNPQETLEQIQNLEKDRLIVQLQRALAAQSHSQNADAEGRYAQNQASFVQSQDLLASLGQQMKIHGFNTQQSTLSFGSGNTALNQSPFLPGTPIAPTGIPLRYGLPTTTQAPFTPTTTTTATPTPGVPTVPPQQGSKGDGTTQVGTSLPAPSHPGTPAATPSGIPVYGGFVPLLPGPSFVAGVPTYGPGLLAAGPVASVQPSGSSPTHFGIPIPVDHGQKPVSGTIPSVAPSAPGTTPSPVRPGAPSSPPVNAIPIPVHPVGTPLHPITPVHPVIPGGQPPHPPVTGTVGHPTYGLQTPAINQVFYKPIKPIYPLYYYPNVAYQLQKPALPAYPWSYAPAYAQAKPAQIWK